MELIAAADFVRLLNIVVACVVLVLIISTYIVKGRVQTFTRKLLWLGCAVVVFAVGYGTAEVLWWPEREIRVFFLLTGLTILMGGFLRELRRRD